MIFNEICSGCVRNSIRVSPATLQQREHAKNTKESIVELKKLAQFQLHDGLNERLPYLRGITDPLPICKAIGVDKEDFIEFHKLAINAAKRNQLSKLFDFVGKDGSTFRAIGGHTARFQVELAPEEDHVEGDPETRVLSLTNPVVSKVYNGLLLLRKIFTTEVYAIKCVDTGEVIRPRIPPTMASRGTRWGQPMVLFSKGKKDTKSVPRSAFTNQALHCDFQPVPANANAQIRGKPVPYSIIVNCSPEDAIIHGCGLSPLQVIAHKRYTRAPMYEDLPTPVPISIPVGFMVAFRGDYVHGGTCYDHHHTRIFMGLSLLNDANGVNTTHLEEDAKHPPSDIQEEGKGPIPTKAPLPDTESTSRRVRLPSREVVQRKKRRAFN
jgi:hypothetical protein